MSEANDKRSGSSDGLHCSGAKGTPRGDDFGVQGTAMLQSIVKKIEERMRACDIKARKARRKKQDSFETMYTSQILGLIDARNIVLEMLEPVTQHEGTKPST